MANPVPIPKQDAQILNKMAALVALVLHEEEVMTADEAALTLDEIAESVLPSSVPTDLLLRVLEAMVQVKWLDKAEVDSGDPDMWYLTAEGKADLLGV
jgi:hypothetical protein